VIRSPALCLLFLTLCACQPSDPPASAASVTASAGAEDAVARVGDVTMHASVMQTSSLDDGVAKDYGIVRSENTVLLLIAVRKGADAKDTALPATITATATDLAGRIHPIAMRELRTGSLLDYVGTVETGLPDTLRFDVAIVRENGERSDMQFNREFFPR
jgi:Domain of unknown function (DUF4426)